MKHEIIKTTYGYMITSWEHKPIFKTKKKALQCIKLYELLNNNKSKQNENSIN